ncbi:MAG: helix-turn-helix transcriptional regulator [Fimbriimonadaceae bacterium]|nr:helix-turn-helix transcriptional regulator [Fimbriimonadaceae bacterium]
MRSQDNLTAANLLRGNTPILVLAILRDGKAHGYAIASEIARRSENALEFKQGTLYPLLHELERDGLIVSEWEIPEGERPRRVYTITETGLSELDKRLRAWQKLSHAVIRVTGVSLDEPAPEN